MKYFLMVKNIYQVNKMFKNSSLISTRWQKGDYLNFIGWTILQFGYDQLE